tara:strand:+ start:615 stop:983 length:369 start_codon:yes stop_codon:yes gene_type:complete
MQKLITELNESIKWKLKDIERYTKMINLVAGQDVRGIRKFIFECDTSEREMFYEYLQWGDPTLFYNVYPKASEQKGDYVTQIIFNQMKDDIKELGLMKGDDYPEDYSDFEKENCDVECGCKI